MADAARVERSLNEAPMSGYRLGAIALCVLIAVIDGMDFVAVGVVAPMIEAELGLGTAQIAAVLGATQVGAAIGAVTLGRAADRFGRKLLILISLYMIAGFTLLTALCGGFGSLLVVRFMVGVALTGALPATLAICSELAPARRKASVLALVVAGFPAGAAIGTAGGGALALATDWRVVFYVGTAIPILLAAAVHARMPESPNFLARTDYRGDKIDAVMRRLIPAGGYGALWRPVPRTEMSDEDARARRGGASFGALFEGGLARQTWLLWSLLLCSGILSNVTLVWLVTIFDRAGFTPGYAFAVGTAINVGAMFGMASAGRLLETLGARVTVGVAFAVATVATAGLGQVDAVAVAAPMGAVMGYFLGITTSAGYALATLIYPSAARSTGVGAAAAALRVGTVVAPVLIPVVLALALPVGWTFAAVAVIPAIAALIASRLGAKSGRTKSSATRTPPAIPERKPA